MLKEKDNINMNSLICDFAHHAYCLVGDKQSILNELHEKLAEQLNFTVAGNPDYWFGEYNNFLVEHSRELVSAGLNKPVVNPYKIIVVTANSLNLNAQNSLLKFLEEPTAHTKIFIILPSAGRLLPTIKSRLLVLEVGEQVESDNELLDANKFLTSGTAKRLEMTAAITKALSDEEIVKNDVVAFLHQIQKVWASHLVKTKMTAKDSETFKEMEKCCSYAEDQSPSIKTLLEYLALVLPKNVINK